MIPGITIVVLLILAVFITAATLDIHFKVKEPTAYFWLGVFEGALLVFIPLITLINSMK